jgi:hypothetical protein
MNCGQARRLHNHKLRDCQNATRVVTRTAYVYTCRFGPWISTEDVGSHAFSDKVYIRRDHGRVYFDTTRCRSRSRLLLFMHSGHETAVTPTGVDQSCVSKRSSRRLADLAAEIIVTAIVRERQRSTAALASASWVLRSSSGDGVDDESRDRTE